MKEYIFDELGYFTETEIKRLAERLNGTTYMNFKVSCSNCAGNCILIVMTDYDAPAEKIKRFFLNAALSRLARI